nr:ATP-binding protein [Duffyella gerundensis]
MFLSASIENFRSIKNRSTISFLASGSKEHHPGHIYSSEKSGHNVLKSSGFYGANASGKSNFLLAFEAIRYMTVGSGNLKEGDKIPCYEPYRLSKNTKNSPTTFEIEFLSRDEVKYVYKISYDESKVVEEILDFYPNKVKSNVFYRGIDDSWETIKFGGNYKGGTKKVAFFENNTYLSKAGDNASTPQMIRDVYNFFRQDCIGLRTSERFKINSSSVDNINDVMDKISKVLCYVDTGIKGITMTEVDVELPEFIEKNIPDEVRKIYIDNTKDKFLFTHVGEDGVEAVFDEEDESDGTRKIFSMMHPLMEAFKDRTVFIFDELDNGLHPHIADMVIRLFNDKTVNKVGSQLIFSTHNMQIMSSEKMRRDQIWFVEKNEGNSRCYSLDDFDKKKVKPTTPYHVWYDDGRFGGVPTINYTKIKSLILDLNGEQDVDPDIFGIVDSEEE